MVRISQAELSKAWAALGVPEGSDFAVSRSAYKKLALKVHPDKNVNGSADTTIEFQRLTAAAGLLEKYENNPTGQREAQQYEPEDEGFESEDEQYGFPGGMGAEDFYEFMFQNLFSGGMPRGMESMFGGGMPRGMESMFGGGGGFHSHGGGGMPHGFSGMPREAPESAAQYGARKAHEREVKARAVAEMERKERVEREARDEKVRAEMAKGAAQRDKKNAERKIRLEQERLDGIKRAKDRLRNGQIKRSEAFAKARAGDGKAVRDLIWNESVGCGDVEFLPSFVVPEDLIPEPVITPTVPHGKKKKGKKPAAPTAPIKKAKAVDNSETLLHIASKHDDLELVEWLLNHGATPEERTKAGFTAFHSALAAGRTKVVNFFLESTPPAFPAPKNISLDHYDAYYPLPPGETLLSLAVTSMDFKMVAVIAPFSNDVGDAASNWEWVEGVQAGAGLGGPARTSQTGDDEYSKWEQVKFELANIICPPEPKQRGRR